MVFYTGKVVLKLDNPTIVMITDRNDLDDQLFDTFAACTDLLRQTPKQAENREHLKDLLKVASGGVIFTTIQKFQPETGNQYEELSSRRNIVVIADEAHRTQYGFAAKTIDEKDVTGNVIGKKTVYGFANYLRDALPNATYNNDPLKFIVLDMWLTGFDAPNLHTLYNNYKPMQGHSLMQAIALVNRIYLALIRAVHERILILDNGKKRYLDQVNALFPRLLLLLSFTIKQ